MENWVIEFIFVVLFIVLLSACLLPNGNDPLAEDYKKVLEDMRFERYIKAIYRRK